MERGSDAASADEVFRRLHGEQRGDAYGRLLRVARHLNRAALAAHTPVSMAADAFVEDEPERKNIRRALHAIEALSGAPVVLDRGRAGLQTLRESPDKQEALRVVGTEWGKEALIQSAPLVDTILRELIF